MPLFDYLRKLTENLNSVLGLEFISFEKVLYRLGINESLMTCDQFLPFKAESKTSMLNVLTGDVLEWLN